MMAIVENMIEEPLEVEIVCSDLFRPLYNLPKDINIVVLIGGRGGMKTYEASKFIAHQATMEKNRCMIMRDEKSLIKESILNEVLLHYDKANENNLLSPFYEKMETGIKDRSTGEMLVLTKGFRASDNQKKANLKSMSNVDIAVIEEAEDIRDVDKFNTFHDSIRKEGSLIIIILNTPDINHWIVKRYFNTAQAMDDEGYPLDGFFKIIPKVIPGFMCIQSSFEDNKWLPASTVERYWSYGDPTSSSYNPHHYFTAIKGYSSTGRKGQILKKVKPIKLAEYLALPYKEVYGQDFGTASPAGFVGVKFHKNTSYCREINYLPKNVLAIGKMYCELGLGDDHKVIADSAEPDTIEKLQSGWKREELSIDDALHYTNLLKGFWVESADKGPGSIKAGLGAMDGMELYAVEESINLWDEIRNYIWATDRNGNLTGHPIDDFNHLIDPWRYTIQERKTPSNLKNKMAYLR